MSNVQTFPDQRGRFGDYGGKFVPETLMPALEELEEAYRSVQGNARFQEELASLLKHYAGRPTPLYHASNLSRHLGGAQLYLKREDLAHTGAHKINNALGQGLLARHMGKQRIIAETGAGQHGVAAATVCAMLGLECVVYMGEEDMRRQAPNVYRMRLLGAQVVQVESGTRTLKDAINETIRDWVTNVQTTHYLLGSAVGPHPYPLMVRDFQSVIGTEARQQMLDATGRLPDYALACVGGGSNAIGLFHPFIADEEVRLTVWRRRDRASSPASTPPACQGAGRACSTAPSPTCFRTTTARYGRPTASPRAWTIPASARSTPGSRTPSAPPTSPLQIPRRWRGSASSAVTEGIIPALEPAHAIAYAAKLAPTPVRGHDNADLPQRPRRQGPPDG